jgi:hypothetical protein
MTKPPHAATQKYLIHKRRQQTMSIYELVIEMKLLERRLTLYEEKYGILSEDFYEALMAGKLAKYDEYDETRTDFSRWKGIYETWQRRKHAYTEQLTEHDVIETLRIQPAY